MFKYEICNCKERITHPRFLCACGNRHDIDNKMIIIHWKREHWQIECALNFALKWMTIISQEGCIRPVYEHSAPCYEDSSIKIDEYCGNCWAYLVINKDEFLKIPHELLITIRA